MTNDQRSRAKDSKPGVLSRLAAGLARTELEFEARELQEDTGRLGATPIGELADRCEASVCGLVRSVTLRPRVNVPALVVELYDGSKTLNLIWLGRRRIGGIVPG
ncbi:MAG: single stranded DNA-binding domain-containing protein, partial [Dermatophilaceae bacterium]